MKKTNPELTTMTRILCRDFEYNLAFWRYCKSKLKVSKAIAKVVAKASRLLGLRLLAALVSNKSHFHMPG